jgi:voltage-gated potassium channel
MTAVAAFATPLVPVYLKARPGIGGRGDCRCGWRRPSITKREGRNRHIWQRNFRAAWRDTLLLLRQFAWPLFLFGVVMIGSGLLYFSLAQRSGQPSGSPVESIYVVLAMTFLQSVGDFPDLWFLQVFYFVMPLIGIAILATGLADFGRLFFNRRTRAKEWEMAVASTFRDHVILVGLGHLGFRVMRAIHELGQEVVVVSLDPEVNLIDSAQRMGIPVIQDDAQREEALINAGMARARAIVICTQNDVLNLQVAFKARRINPDIQVVVRIFEDQFAREVSDQFNFTALSATGMAAPMFAAAACGMDITPPITVEGQLLSLASLEVKPASELEGLSVGEVEARFNVSVVLLRHDGLTDYHPHANCVLAKRDVLAVLGGPEQLGIVTVANQ